MNDSILFERDERGVVTLTLNRPHIHNAFDEILIADLTRRLQAVSADKTVRVVVLTGADRSFSAGADITWMKSMTAFSAAENRADAKRLADLMQLLDGLNKPTVARVNGSAFGGGVGLIACCDIAVAVDTAKFALTEVRLGLVPAVISPFVIAAIGQRNARRFFQSAEAMDAMTAREIGLVHLVCAPDKLDQTVAQQLDLLVSGGPGALSECKTLINEVAASMANAVNLQESTVKRIARLRVSPEGQEGLTAFLEKRKPKW